MFVGSSELVTAGVQQPEGVRSELAVRVWLDGPYSPSHALMHDSLRTRGLLPTSEPYSSLGYPTVGLHGGSVVAPGTFSASGSNAIVDWIFVELRASSDPATVLASRPALLQRDGDVVDLDGFSPVSITALPGIYHLAVRHRNHLPVMTLLPIVIGPGPNLVDLTSSGIALHVPTARRDLNGVLLLWSGDARGNEDVKYTGASNDRDVLLLAIGGLIPTNTVTAYSRSDLNMDGTVKYTGSQNDRDIILRSIGGAVLTTVRSQPLP